VRYAEVVVNVGIVGFQLRRLAIFADGFAVIPEVCVRLAEIVVGLGIVGICVEVLLVSFDRLFILGFGIFAFFERFVAEGQTKMGLGEIGIQFERLLKRVDCFGVLIVAV
jgi:hypothetical protein